MTPNPACSRCGGKGFHRGLGGCGSCGGVEVREELPPEKDPEYLAMLHARAERMGLDPRVFQSVRMADPRCDACSKPAPRYCCDVCPEDEIAPGVVTRRCGDCFAKHFDAVHDMELPEKRCFLCKKGLGHSPPAVSGAGAPRCAPGDCGRAWWKAP